MKITMKLLSFISDLHDDVDDIVHKLFNEKNNTNALPPWFSRSNTIKSWEYRGASINITYIDYSDAEWDISIPFEDICEPDKAIERYKEEGKIKAELEQRKIAERIAASERAKLEEELQEFERLRKKFENK